MWQYSLKKGIMKKFENWRYRENKRSPDFVEQKARKKKQTEGTFSRVHHILSAFKTSKLFRANESKM